jgi:hypothetical protein
MKTPIPLEDARNRLAAIWFGGALVPFLILVVQSVMGHYGDSVQKVWAWFVPTLGPSLALILGVIGAMALAADEDPRCVKPFFLRLATGISVVYLTVLTLTFLLEPIGSVQGMELFTLSNYWLAPLQSLAVAALTVLFTSHESPAASGAKAASPSS